MTGGYEEILQPIVIDDRFDYILFSNDFEKKEVGKWVVRNIPKVLDTDDNKRTSRYPKSHPETMLSEYDASLYVDANIQIADKWVYDRIIELSESKVQHAGVKLLATGRDDIYRHAYDMCVMKAENDMNAIRQCHALYELGFPEHYGLNENNIIFRSHTEFMRQVDEEWWWWIKNYSFRDQFSYMYCLWKFKVKREFFLPEGKDAHNNGYFVFTYHNDNESVKRKKWVKTGIFETRRNVNRLRCKEKYDLYCEHWVKLCKFPFPQFMLFIWGIYVDIWNTSRSMVRRMIDTIWKFRKK